MDNFLKSGAVSRHHYALTHKVENAKSIQEADVEIWKEVERIRAKASNGLTDIYEELVVLIYCQNTATHRTVSALDLEFAFSPAVNLAATGRTIKQRRMGLTFCALFMPRDHPLQLMLVNTLRKEIESEDTSRIVLALDFIVSSPNEFLAPSVVPRLEVLLSHRSQHIRRRAIFAIHALDRCTPADVNPADLNLANHKQTVIRRLTRAAREENVSLDETGAVDALLFATRRLLETNVIMLADVIPSAAALLEKIIARSKKAKRKSRPEDQGHRLVIPLVRTLRCAVTISEQNHSDSSAIDDITKLAIRIIHAYSNQPASAQVLEAFRLLGALPVKVVHTLLFSIVNSLPSPQRPPSRPKSTAQHPVLILRPLLTSRDPTERWTGLSCLAALDPSLWAGTPLDGTREVIPPILDEWEVESIMRGLGDQDQTLRKLTMRVLNGVDPNLLHTYLDQILTPPPTSNAKHQYGDPLEVVSFIYSKDSAGFIEGVSRILDRDKGTRGVDEKLVEGIVSILHEGEQDLRSAFADAMLQRIQRSHSDSLVSPITAGSSSNVIETQMNNQSSDPTTVLLFATAANNLSADVRQAIDVLLTFLDESSVGIQEVLLLAALRLVPRLDQSTDRSTILIKVETFARRPGVGRHIRRRCDLFAQYAKDPMVLQSVVDRTNADSLPEFLQALLSNKQSSSVQMTPNDGVTPDRSPELPTGRSVISPTFSTVSLSGTSALRYDAYAPPHATPRRARPALESPLHRISVDSSTSNDSPFVRGQDAAGDMVSQAADERRTGKSKATINESVGQLRLDMSTTPRTLFGLDPPPNPNTDLITLGAVESPFREETEFGALNMSGSFIRDPIPDVRPESPRINTSRLMSPRPEGSDLAPADADAIWNSFDATEEETKLGKQTVRGWCDRATVDVGRMLREMGIGFITHNIAVNNGNGREVLAYIPSPNESPDSEIAHAAVRLRPAEDGSCLWMLRCKHWDMRVKIRKVLDGDSG